MWLCLALSTSTFLTESNLINLMRQASLWAIIAVGQTFVIITGGIDLSVGAVVGFSGVVLAMALKAGLPIWISILLTLGVGPFLWLFPGFGVIRLGPPPFILPPATLTPLA